MARGLKKLDAIYMHGLEALCIQVIPKLKDPSHAILHHEIH